MRYAILVLVVLVGFLLLSRRTPTVSIPMPIPSSNPQMRTQPSVTIEHNGTIFAVYVEKIDPSRLTLIPNFTEQLSSSEIVQKYHCKAGINGGFYTTAQKPLGLFITDNHTLGTRSESKMVNGFLIKDTHGVLSLSEELPTTSIEFTLQSGPYFTPETKLSIINDEPARRVLIGTTIPKEWYLIVVTEKDNTNSGPLLGGLPALTKKLHAQAQGLRSELFSFESLLNLDGGSASTFHGSDGTVLSELTAIGSFLCIQ